MIEGRRKFMKVKILKATFDTYWYANCIGETFEVKETEENYGYDVIDEDKARQLDKNSSEEYFGWCIYWDDCEIIEE
jgi:hypothetical protein